MDDPNYANARREFPDLLYPEAKFFNARPYDVLLELWPATTIDLTTDKKFTMQKISSSKMTDNYAALTLPFIYSVAMDDLSNMNKYTLSTKYGGYSTKLIHAELNDQDYLVYIGGNNQLNVQAVSDNSFDELLSNTNEHLISINQQRFRKTFSTNTELLACIGNSKDEDKNNRCLSIAVTDRSNLFFYRFDSENNHFDQCYMKNLSDNICSLSFNPYVPSFSIFIDDKHQIHLVDFEQESEQIIVQQRYYHQQQKDIYNQIESQLLFIGWDSSPFLFTSTNSHYGCKLYDTRIHNECIKNLFQLNKPYLHKLETIRLYQSSITNEYQHIFITDYTVILIDSRMADRTMIYTKHELLRPPKSFTQVKLDGLISLPYCHKLLINDEHNTNIIEYGLDNYNRIIQLNSPWEPCSLSNSRYYISNDDVAQQLMVRSIYFDLPTNDIATINKRSSKTEYLLFQLNSAGNLHVQLFGQCLTDEKTWNPNPDMIMKKPPTCFSEAMKHWASKFLKLFQCEQCLVYNVEPSNLTIVTPFKAMTSTTLKAFPIFKNTHSHSSKEIQSEMTRCPTCQCFPVYDENRAQVWIQDWKKTFPKQSSLSITPSKTTDQDNKSINATQISESNTSQTANKNWQEFFDLAELKQANLSYTLFNEIETPWQE